MKRAYQFTIWLTTAQCQASRMLSISTCISINANRERQKHQQRSFFVGAKRGERLTIEGDVQEA